MISHGLTHGWCPNSGSNGSRMLFYANMNEKKCLVWISETRKRNISWESVIYIIMQYTIWQNVLFEHFLSNMFDTISKLNKILFYIWYNICISYLFASLKGTSVSISIQSVQNHCRKKVISFFANKYFNGTTPVL